MKTIELKEQKETILFNGKEIEMPFHTTEMIETVLNRTGKEGITVSDMHSRIKILDKVREAQKGQTTTLELEDAEYQTLAKLAHEAKWSVVSKSIVEFVNSFDLKSQKNINGTI